MGEDHRIGSLREGLLISLRDTSYEYADLFLLSGYDAGQLTCCIPCCEL
jgi:hypothetical protein